MQRLAHVAICYAGPNIARKKLSFKGLDFQAELMRQMRSGFNILFGFSVFGFQNKELKRNGSHLKTNQYLAFCISCDSSCRKMLKKGTAGRR